MQSRDSSLVPVDLAPIRWRGFSASAASLLSFRRSQMSAHGEWAGAGQAVMRADIHRANAAEASSAPAQ